MVKNRKKNFDDSVTTIIVEEEEIETLPARRLLDLAHSISDDDQNPG
jgi:hypothetical protein